MVHMVTGFEPAGDRRDVSDKRRSYLLAIIAGVFAIIAALAGSLVTTHHPWPWSSRNSTCRSNLTIRSPRGGSSINGSRGVKVKGVACDMSGQTGWLFDYDLEDHYYYMDFPVDSTAPSPVVVGNGTWAYMDQPIGNPGDKNQTYGIAIVDASKSCSYKLQSAQSDSAGDVKFKSFPAGCQIDDVTNIFVTYP